MVFAGIASIWHQFTVGLAVGLFIYIIWSIYQLNKIHGWLVNLTDDEPPEAPGLWGEIFDNIYHLQRRNKEEKSRLKATVDYLQDSFSSLADAVVMVDKRGNIVWSNKSAEHLLGLNYPQDMKQYLPNLIREPKFTDYFHAEVFDQYLEIISPANDYVTLQVHITFFGKRNKLLFARDVTNMIQLERMRQDFVANVSHELRTPLTVIRGYLETFQDFQVSEDDHFSSALKQMLGQTHRMDTLVKDLIMLSRLETVPKSQQPEKINIGDLAANICNELIASGIEQRTLNNYCPQDVFLLGDLDEIRSAFTNLLTNAVRYTDSDGTIEVSWKSDENGGFFKVTDNGVGISAEHIPRVTERFYRVDKSRSVKTGGTGLGLAIVKHILIRHNASLKIESELNHGSTFTCCFSASDVISNSK